MNMQNKGRYLCWMAQVGAIALALCGAPAIAQHAGGHAAAGAGGAHQHLDGRFSHNQYYFDHGYSAGSLGGFHGRDGGSYRFHGGNWYRWRGGAWVVWGAPFGLFVPFLPLYFTTVWCYGIPYYYANDTYYTWDDPQHEYEVVAPPDGIEAAGTTQPLDNNQLFAYPKNGQSSEQQAKDGQECERWAVSQTGFDPKVVAAGVPAAQAAQKRSDYVRAQMTCLEGRGYSVD